MSSILKIFILICGLLFVGVVVSLLVRKKINERNSLLWLVASIFILVLSAIPELLQVLANVIGVDYPPSILFLFSTLILLLVVLSQSIQISGLAEQVKELTQHVAIQNFKSNLKDSNMKKTDNTQTNTDDNQGVIDENTGR